MSTLGDLVAAHCALAGRDVDHLHALVGEWALLADLSFADLLLEVPTKAGGFVCVAQLRPSTGATAHHDDEVGRQSRPGDRYSVERAFREGRIVREGEPEWRGEVPVREEAVPVRYAGRVIGVVTRDTNLAAARVPSQLELAYLQSADELAQMVAEGSFPFYAEPTDRADVTRVGDGLLRVDATGMVTFASPNALSAYRRLGLVGNVTGERLIDVHDWLGVADAPVSRTLATGRPIDAELASDAAEVLLRAIPLLSGS
ncbi:MAG: histidine kinase N-terminal domain-containing protein, partial [Mycobacteriales bacterium]